MKSKESCCQERKGLAIISAFKRKYFWEYDAAPLAMLYLKVFKILFHKFFKLISQTQLLCPRIICTEH